MTYELGDGAGLTDEQARAKAYALMSDVVRETVPLLFSFRSVMAGEETTVEDVFKEYVELDKKLEEVYAILRPF